MTEPEQGEIWWAETEHRRRPVLIVTRSQAIPILNRVVVAPVTRTVRGIPTEIPLGRDDGVPHESVASFDNLQPVRRVFLIERLSATDADRRRAICRALSALADC